MKSELQKKLGTPMFRAGRALAILAILINFIFGLAFAEKIQYDSGAKRDPMVPLIGPDGYLSQKTVSPSDFNIEGIIVDRTGDSVALINGEVYKTGDRVGQAVIVQILKDRVLLSLDDEEKVLWLREEIIKKETPVE